MSREMSNMIIMANEYCPLKILTLGNGMDNPENA